MEYKLTCHVQRNKRDKAGKSNSHILYFLNGVQILKQKFPWDESYDADFQHRTAIYEEFILNGVMHQKRKYTPSGAWWRTDNYREDGVIRNVKYPLSKTILAQFNIPKDFRIDIANR